MTAGTIVSFECGKGFGRVAVDGVGELAFDVTAARLRIEDIVAGLSVEVTLAPSRLGGQRVAAIALPGAKPLAPAPPSPPERRVKTGLYEFLLPDFWVDAKVTEKPGLARLNSIAARDVSFDFNALLGGALDLAQRERVIAGFLQMHDGARHETWNTEVFRAPFVAYALADSPALGPGSLYELFVGVLYEDLIVFGCGLGPAEAPRRERWRMLFFSMVEGAFARLPPPR